MGYPVDTFSASTRTRDGGQSIVEVIIIVAIVAMIVSGLVAATVASIKSATFANTKSQATKYAQEGVEITRRERDLSWNTFFSRRDQTWCMDTAGQWSQVIPCPLIDNKFTRTVQLTWNGADPDPTKRRMEVVATVTWQLGAATHRSEIRTYFTQWR